MPTDDWGPALPEIRQRYAYDAKKGSVADDDQRAHVKAGHEHSDDDVFGDEEMATLTGVIQIFIFHICYI